MRLIDADEHECWACTHHATGQCDTWCDHGESFELRKDVAEAKTVDAVPVVRGEWKRIGSGSLYDRYECANCHRPPKWECLGDNNWRISFTDICPHCGADMRGEKND